MSVRRAQAEITTVEFAEWAAYNRIDPIGRDRDDLRIAMLCTLVASMARSKGQRAPKVADFMPRFEEAVEPVRRTGKQIAAVLNTWARMHNKQKRLK